jgi:hypothetical protein
MTMYTWHQIISGLAQAGPDAVARVAVHEMQHPRDAGITQTFGAPFGQRASYRALLTDGSTLCVENFGTVYEARLERASPVRCPAPPSTPTETIAGLTALGALLGLAFGGKKESALTGALLGGLSGLAAVAVTEAGSSPETSKTALELAKTVSSLLPLATSSSATAPRSQLGRTRGSRTLNARRSRVT